jgi:uncharacterized tannase-like protein DUF6351
MQRRVNRARIVATNGTSANQVIVTVPTAGNLGADIGQRTSPLAIVSRQLFDLMDQWLANIAADSGPGTRAEKVARPRKAETRPKQCFCARSCVRAIFCQREESSRESPTPFNVEACDVSFARPRFATCRSRAPQ